ncbi:MAG: ATP-binding cassette domain-containing protein [Xanthobacteraceae bacterium]|nr:ATP-binding cassette domain-containing protein [Xanthobacteraceae bacterium]
MKIKLTSPLLNELRPLLPAYATLFVLSFFCPLFYLASPIYVEQIFDRVMYSRNLNTLAVLASIAVFMVAMYAVLEWIRKKALGRLGNAIDERLSRVVFEIAHRKGAARATSIIADFNMVREYLSGTALAAIFDAFWSPLFIVVMAIVNWLFGLTGVFMIALAAGMAVLNHRLSKGDSGRYQKLSLKSQEFGMAIARNSEVIRALGMLPPLRDRWYDLHLKMLGWQSAAYGRMEIFTSITKFIRSYQMAGIYTTGTILFLVGDVTMSNTFVAMSLMMRGLGPIDQVISNWKGYSGFLAALERLDGVLRDAARQPAKLSLTQLSGDLTVTRVFAYAPGGEKPLLNDVSFRLPEGHVLGVIGPSGAGKSCLARVLVGAWTPQGGTVAVGDHDLAHWNEDERGRRLGYMPQDTDLLPGTIADNIGRFDPVAAAEPERVIAAAELAGIQDLIRALPNGYNTLVGPNGHVLSGGQRSRITLARAVFGDPRFVVLDEPNSNLDSVAEQSFLAMVQSLKARNVTVVIVTHKLNILNYCDDVLVMNNGTVQAFGLRDQIVNRIPRSTAGPALTVVSRAPEARGVS